MMRYVLALVFLVIASRGDKEAEFFVIKGSFTQHQAAAKCLEKGGMIASFHNDAEYKRAEAKCKAAVDGGGDIHGCWTGLRDDKVEGEWYNEDQSAKDYMIPGGTARKGRPWANNQPNGEEQRLSALRGHSWHDKPYFVGKGEDCVNMRGSSYSLYDMQCNDPNHAICRGPYIVFDSTSARFQYIINFALSNIGKLGTQIINTNTRIDNLDIVITDGKVQKKQTFLFDFQPNTLFMGLLIVNVFSIDIMMAVWCCYSMQKRPKYQAVKAIYSSDDQYMEKVQLK